MPDVLLSAREADLLRLIISCLFSPTTGRHLYPSHGDAAFRQEEALEIINRRLARAGHPSAEPTTPADPAR